jgi:hypothetical protein
MDRRRFLLTSLAGAVAAPLAGDAQQAGKLTESVPDRGRAEANEEYSHRHH